MRTVVLALIGVSLSALAQLLLKLGMLKITALTGHPSSSLGEALWSAAYSPIVWSGLIVYAISALVWVGVLSRMELSAAYPLVAFSIVLTCIFGRVLLAEPLGPIRLVGIGLIIAGVILVGWTGRLGQ